MTFVFPEQYPNPFPSFTAPTDSEEWGRFDARSWLWECDPPAEEIQAIYDETYNKFSQQWSYEDGVSEALYGVKGAGMTQVDIDFRAGALNTFQIRTSPIRSRRV